MKKTIRSTYQYDPDAMRLYIFRNGKNIGGFHGRDAERQFSRLLLSGANISITTMDKEVKRKTLVRRLRATWIKQGVDKHRTHILGAYGVESTADLTIQQLEELLIIYSPTSPPSESVRRLRSNVLSLLTRLDIYKDQNWDDVNSYLMDRRICGKLLYQLGEEELRVLIRKLNSIADKYTTRKKYLNSPEMMN